MDPSLTALVSKECQCGSGKQKGHAFCLACYLALPPDLKNPLFQKVGHGFEGAYAAALAFLKGEGRESSTRNG